MHGFHACMEVLALIIPSLCSVIYARMPNLVTKLVSISNNMLVMVKLFKKRTCRNVLEWYKLMTTKGHCAGYVTQMRTCQ